MRSLGPRTQNGVDATAGFNLNRQDQQRPFFSLLQKSSPAVEVRTMKLEPASSDKAFSPSPPPNVHIPTTSTPTSAIGIGLQNSHVQQEARPHQMLPPPPPPQGPDSRSSSPAPVPPRPQSRSRSRSRSSMAFHRAGEGDGFGFGNDFSMNMGGEAEGDADMSTIAINALRGVRAANAELGEELNALTATHESLKAQHTALSSSLSQTNEQLSTLKSTHEEALRTLLTRDDALRVRDEEQEQAKRLREAERVRVGELRKDFTELGERYTNLRKSFAELKEKMERERREGEEDVRGARKWAGEGLGTVYAELEPLLADDMIFAQTARGLVRELQEELADCMFFPLFSLLPQKSALTHLAAHRVTDLLRDKLHHLSSSLALAQERVRELEEASVRHMKDLVERFEEAATERVKEKEAEKEERIKEREQAAEKNRDREDKERYVPCRIKEAVADLAHRLRRMKIEEMEREVFTLRAIRDLKIAQDVRIETLEGEVREEKGRCDVLADLEDKLRQATEEIASKEEKLVGAQSVVEVKESRCREEEVRVAVLQERFDAQAMTLRLTKEQIVDLQVHLQTSEDTLVRTRDALEGTRALLDMKGAEMERMGGELLGRGDECVSFLLLFLSSGDLMDGVLEKLIALNDPRAEANVLRGENDRLGAESDKLRGESERIKVDEARGGEEIRELTATIDKLKAQINTQANTLKRFADLEATLNETTREKAEEINGLRTEREETREGLHQVEVKAAALQEQVNSLTAALNQTQGRYNDLRKSSASIAQELSDTQSALEVARQEILQRSQDSIRLVNLCERIEEQRARDDEEKQGERARGAAQDEDRKRKEDTRIRELEVQLDRLLTEKGALEEAVGKMGRLRERYDRNELNDDEKDFVEWLMALAASLHEEEDVVKANELRRKENLVTHLQVKIRELESSLARLIKEKEQQAGGASKSMIDLDAFMTSSPISSPVPQTAVVGENLIAPIRAPSVAQPVPALKPSAVPVASALVAVPVAVSAPVAKLTAAPAKQIQSTKTKPLIGLSFSSLDDSDSEEDVPLSEISAAKSVLGKREREHVSSPVKVQQVQQEAPSSSPTPVLNTYKGTRRLVDAFLSPTLF
ncbi:hypothetical protein H0H87_002970 [Tephrocybe sp. NHM501043]|nr:hypothetical protein H0H87_002970 [Tephrocybe sp. NHM501043]